MKLKYLTTLSFSIFLLMPVYAIYAGSTITLPISFKNATVEFFCVDKIAPNEFSLPCDSTILNGTYQKFVCYNMQKLEISINPASNNTCDLFITYWQSIKMPPSTTYFRTETTVVRPIENKTIINQTVIQPVKEIVREVPKTVYYENTTKINQLQKQLDEVRQQLERERMYNALLFMMALISIALLSYDNFKKRMRRKLYELGEERHER